MKNRIQTRFFVVIHTIAPTSNGTNHVIEQARIAQECGADGVFLIPDYAKGPLKATSHDQCAYLKKLKRTHPDFLIGVNFLSNLSDLASEIYSIQPNLLQTDGVSVFALDKEQLPHTEFFCGVAFKYSKNERLTGDTLKEHCVHVGENCDVPTTSGQATGIPADIQKIQEIKLYLPEKRLGIASGVTVENVTEYLNAGVTDFLVATSLVSHVDEFSCDILDKERVISLATKIHSYDK